MTDEQGSRRLEGIFNAERTKAFIDAVVAIAMTLLILPLMESVSDIADADEGAGHWFDEHQMQVVAFILSFVIIGMFWVNHHRLFAQVEHVSTRLLWVCIAWLLAIVWMPVATAMTGLMDDRDPVVKSVYIGTMILISLLNLVQRLLLFRHPELHSIPHDDTLRHMAVDIAMVVLFAVALVLAVVVPWISYFALFLLMLTGPTQRVFARMLGVRRARR